MHIEGACHCGLISFTAQIDPSRVMVCHCSDCQVFSGSPFRVVVPAAIESFHMRGEPKHYIKVAESGNRRVQAFCPECGTPIYATAASDPQVFNIRVGTAHQRAELRPKTQGWCRSARDWVNDLHSIRQFATQRTR